MSKNWITFRLVSFLSNKKIPFELFGFLLILFPSSFSIISSKHFFIGHSFCHISLMNGFYATKNIVCELLFPSHYIEFHFTTLLFAHSNYVQTLNWQIRKINLKKRRRNTNYRGSGGERKENRSRLKLMMRRSSFSEYINLSILMSHSRTY